MLQSHANDPSCVLTGSSTHTERIERLWRDLHRAVINFSNTSSELESDDADMFCLQCHSLQLSEMEIRDRPHPPINYYPHACEYH